MIFANSKALFQCMALTITLWSGALGSNVNNNDSEVWVDRARKLQSTEFMEICGEVFMSPDHMHQQSYLMSDFADEVTNLCLKFAPNPDQGTCTRNGFGSLNPSFQNAFFRHASQQHMGKQNLPIAALMAMGDAGYIVSDKTAIEQATMRNDLCVEVHASFGDDFINQIPISNIPVIDIADPVPDPIPVVQVVVPEKSPKTPESEYVAVPNKTELNVGEDELNSGNSNSEPFTIVQVEKEDPILSIAAIIAVSCAVAALIAFFFYYDARRRDEARKNRMPRSGNGKRSIGEDGVIKVTTSSGNRKMSSFGSFSTSSSRSVNSTFTPIEEIKAAINNANWDNVYKLASQLAENDDGLSLPSIGSFKGQTRSHLGAEDQERSNTLDELAANGDWTGLAVTAALYAGETSGSSHDHSSSTFTYGADEPSSRRETRNASKNQDIEEGQASMEQLVGGLSAALNAGDWSRVTKFANLIKDKKNTGSSFDTDPQVLLTNSGFSSSTSSISSSSTTDTEMSKKQTIEKLMRAGKWKGVSIMANMYEMESKQSNRSSSMRPYPTSPTHPYNDKRSIVRTKELRHEDRVQENIVGFRRDP